MSATSAMLAAWQGSDLERRESGDRPARRFVEQMGSLEIESHVDEVIRLGGYADLHLRGERMGTDGPDYERMRSQRLDILDHHTHERALRGVLP